jgi:hypothetical protein
MAAITVMEVIAFDLTVASLGSGIFIYYTEISNLITLISSVITFVYLLVTFNKPLEFPKWLSGMRFLSATMLLMTMLITIFVLVPHSPHLTNILLFEGYGLYHHTLVPILTLISYVFFEPHFSKFKVTLIPLAVTFIYGFIMIFGNIFGKVSGPYFFLRVHNQPVLTTVIWCLALLLIAFIFASIIYLLAFFIDFIKVKIKKQKITA